MEKVATSLEKVDSDYDEEADVLYISFGKPRKQRIVLRLKMESYIG